MMTLTEDTPLLCADLVLTRVAADLAALPPAAQHWHP
jgi:hypothetical protein